MTKVCQYKGKSAFGFCPRKATKLIKTESGQPLAYLCDEHFLIVSKGLNSPSYTGAKRREERGRKV